MRRDWLLAFLSAHPAGRPGPALGSAVPLDPIRIQKGLFLFQEQDTNEVVAPLTDPPYQFEPYAYGPFTQPIYTDLDELLQVGLVEQLSVPSADYSRWRATPPGHLRAEQLLTAGTIPPEMIPRLRAAKALVTGRRFAELLRYVYSRYPDYATESVAKL